MILVYTGNGKGKTSSCVGQAIRAIGQGFTVFFAQIIKTDVGAGEQKMLRSLLGERYFIGGKGFFFNEADRPKHRDAALKTLDWCIQAVPQADMLIVDEMLYAIGSGLVTQEEVLDLVNRCNDARVHLVLSGRGLPDWLEDKADLVSLIDEVKHPSRNGVQAQKGIEF